MARIDELIKKEIVDQLVRDERVDASKINVDVTRGYVTLKGAVQTYFARTCAEEDAFEIFGVMDVDNQLLVVYDNNVPMPSDLEIKSYIINRLERNPDIEPVHIDPTVDTGRVVLKGTVDAYWKKIHAENLVMTEPGVLFIENQLAVVPTDDVMDKVIAENIMETIAVKSEVDAGDVELTVEDGSVLINGTVPNYRSRKAVNDAAFYTKGVREVTNRLAVTAM